ILKLIVHLVSPAWAHGAHRMAPAVRRIAVETRGLRTVFTPDEADVGPVGALERRTCLPRTTGVSTQASEAAVLHGRPASHGPSTRAGCMGSGGSLGGENRHRFQRHLLEPFATIQVVVLHDVPAHARLPVSPQM